jgi:hypothetical protein
VAITSVKRKKEKKIKIVAIASVEKKKNLK